MFRLGSYLAVLVAAATLVPSSADLDTEWATFKVTYGKRYSAQDEMNRKMIFKDNLDFIRKHNTAADNGHESFRVGVNEYSDLTNEEFVDRMSCLIQGNSTQGKAYVPADNIHLPATVDWRTKGYVTGVKNQGVCGSCWAFSATGSLEGQHARAAGKLVSLSEQNLVDCTSGNHGCGGGWPNLAFSYIQRNHGMDTEKSYPYEAKEGLCRFKKAYVGATITGHSNIPRGQEYILQEAVATNGPISVCIDSSGPFQDYKYRHYASGVYYNPRCSSTQIHHCVLVVGYGTSNGTDYWLVKNSWGVSWGKQGYVLMSRNKNNNCGIASRASFPLVKSTE